jgi:hypothetical protein
MGWAMESSAHLASYFAFFAVKVLAAASGKAQHERGRSRLHFHALADFCFAQGVV